MKKSRDTWKRDRYQEKSITTEERHFYHRFVIYPIGDTRLLVLIDTMGIVPYSVSIRHLIWTLLTSSIRYCTLNSQLLLVNFYFFYPNFRLRQIIFPWYFLPTFNFLHKLQYFLEPFQQPTYLAHLKKSAQMLSSSLFTVLHVTNN